MNVQMDVKLTIGVKLAAGFIFANLLIMFLSIAPFLSIDRLMESTSLLDRAAGERLFVAEVAADLQEAGADAGSYMLSGRRIELFELRGQRAYIQHSVCTDDS